MSKFIEKGEKHEKECLGSGKKINDDTQTGRKLVRGKNHLLDDRLDARSIQNTGGNNIGVQMERVNKYLRNEQYLLWF